MDALSFPILTGCLLLGLVLLAIEAFVTPGLGVPGLLGAALVVVAVVFAFTYHGLGGGFLALGSAGAVIAVFAAVAKVTLGRHVFLAAALSRPPPADEEVADLVGLVGVALTMLRPSGTALFGERRVDVTTEADFVDAGTPVVCVGVQGHRVSVRPQGGDS